MERLLRSESPLFQVIGDTEQTLQIVLFLHQSIITHKSYIMYISPRLSARTHSKGRINLTNKSAGAEYIGLSSCYSGKVLALDPSIMDSPLVVKETNILAYVPSVNISPESNITPYLKKYKWASVSGSGLLFLQEPSIIIEKRLAENESIKIDFKSIFAFNSSITVIDKPSLAALNDLLKFKSLILHLKGPGSVFITASNWKNTKKFARAKKFDSFYLFVCCFALVIFKIILVFI